MFIQRILRDLIGLVRLGWIGFSQPYSYLETDKKLIFGLTHKEKTIPRVLDSLVVPISGF